VKVARPLLGAASDALARGLRAHGFGPVAKLLTGSAEPTVVGTDALLVASVLDGLRAFWVAVGSVSRATECRTWTRVAVLLWRAAEGERLDEFHGALRDARR